MNYLFVQWIFFFYFYCFLGWCWETSYVSIRTKHFVNRGFMRGPFLPIYGSGAITMLLVSAPFSSNIILTYISGLIGATVLEYITGVAMEALFKVRYWDYSTKKFNYKGHICLSSSLCWGFFTVIMTFFLHKEVSQVVDRVPANVLELVTFLLTVYIVADFSVSFKAAMDLRNLLVQMENAKREVARLQKRLDVMVAVYGDRMERAKEALAENAQNSINELTHVHFSELAEGVLSRMNHLQEKVLQEVHEKDEEFKAELLELRMKLHEMTSEHTRIAQIKDFFTRDLIRSNPGMISTKYAEQLETLKNTVLGHKK